MKKEDKIIMRTLLDIVCDYKIDKPERFLALDLVIKEMEINSKLIMDGCDELHVSNIIFKGIASLTEQTGEYISYKYGNHSINIFGKLKPKKVDRIIFTKKGQYSNRKHL